ncbi:MAG: thioredoxin [Hamadaea sp.]|uniref:thioredoxin n=1 Tax=Hamadaea sp. TaxID=2024425 RepID=UPI001830B2AD|nr:thioredoxin [Hamadaea sp.]NUR73074.1 thioredoxin [Hamadaea sp.]NUT18304.1 thioredoxin [Hamadaea sp.]
MTLSVTDAAFADEVLGAYEPVLVEFWAEWCPPCHKMAPVLDQLSGEYAGRAKVAKLNADENPATARAYGVMAMPTFALFSGGQVVWQVVGAQPASRLRSKLDEAISAAASGVRR